MPHWNRLLAWRVITSDVYWYILYGNLRFLEHGKAVGTWKLSLKIWEIHFCAAPEYLGLGQKNMQETWIHICSAILMQPRTSVALQQRLLLKLLKCLFFETLLSKQACFYWWLGHLAHIEVSQQLHVKPRRGNSNAHNTERTLIIADHCGFIQLISYLLRSLEQNLSTWTCAK